MNTLIKTFCTFIADIILQDLIRSVGVSSESIKRFNFLWAEYGKTTEPNENYTLNFIQENDFDDKEKLMVGMFLFHSAFINRIKTLKEDF